MNFILQFITKFYQKASELLILMQHINYVYLTFRCNWIFKVSNKTLT